MGCIEIDSDCDLEEQVNSGNTSEMSKAKQAFSN